MERTRADADDAVDRRLRTLAEGCRAVFFAGLPGTGKSFFVHRLAALAHAAGRPVHLLLWDVIRPVFEASPVGRRYPVRAGITHPVIRRAAGIWARRAVARWDAGHPAVAALIGESPLVGHRFIELARSADDAAEPLLAGDACAFVVPVPSVEVRRFLEAERHRRSVQHRHDREREDAVPAVVQTLWGELVDVSRKLGIERPGGGGGSPAYDPALYECVYRRVLARRHAYVLGVERVLPAPADSVYAFAFPTHDVTPTVEDADACIEAVETQYADRDVLDREIAGWYLV
ncbi:MAG TPA: hypothetical protein VKZ50_20880 [bacterium]|nr:hypothetical protein [bacterium]